MRLDRLRIYVSAPEGSHEVTDDWPEYAAPSQADARLFGDQLAAWQGRLLPRRGLELARRLQAEGVEIVWYLDYWDYPTIEDEIARSTALLAITDAYYFSGTGKMIELTYAGGHVASGERPPIAPIPVLIFPIDESYREYRHLEGPGSWTVLSANVEVALDQALQRLR